MASWDETYKRVIEGNEGGYAPAFAGSGETYKGIDRKYNTEWVGWPLIDAYKRTKGTPQRGALLPIPGLDKMVKDWYQKTYIGTKLNFDSIRSQTVADMIIDFLVHKNFDAIRVINTTAKSIDNNVSTANTAITASVVNVINNKSYDFYNRLRKNRILYYQNPAMFGSSLSFSLPFIAAFVKRVNTFPTALPWYEGISWLFYKI